MGIKTWSLKQPDLRKGSSVWPEGFDALMRYVFRRIGIEGQSCSPSIKLQYILWNIVREKKNP